MTYDPERNRRRSIRLKGYDYTRPGAYFVTICTQNQECLFGEVVDGEMRLHQAGHMVQAEWNALPDRFPSVGIDAFVVMPNHVHGIIVMSNDIVGAGLVPALNGATTRVAPTIWDLVGAFKSRTTVLYTDGVNQIGWTPFRSRLWQRNYYEHLIRNESSLNHIRQYILANPLRWAMDRENPNAVEPEPKEAWRPLLLRHKGSCWDWRTTGAPERCFKP